MALGGRLWHQGWSVATLLIAKHLQLIRCNHPDCQRISIYPLQASCPLLPPMPNAHLRAKPYRIHHAPHLDSSALQHPRPHHLRLPLLPSIGRLDCNPPPCTAP